MADLLSAAALEGIFSLDEFEPLARERMEPGGFDYVAGGAWDEISLRESVEAWRRKRFVPRVLTDVRSVDTYGSFLGRPAAIPVAMAPMAVQSLAHRDGEVEAVRGAAAGRIPYTLSTTSSRTIEEVAAAAPDAERWFQLYLVGSPAHSRALVERATAAGYRAIILTVDLPVVGHRPRDLRSGFVFPALPHAEEASPASASRYGPIADQHELGLGWHLVDEIRSWTHLPLVLKGILSPLDAARAAEMGVDAIVVSTHGARQLDRVIATADALPGIVDAVAGRTEVWVDGGIRSGLDVLMAFALGATGTLVGRPLYWSLATGGAAGVERAVAILREELAVGLALLGVERPGMLDRSYLA
ncbi:MAG: 4-hydroxymandelate oxidase [Chloroflexota bacterium]|jgi:4-hydroxymandelate oxidase|nr:4-hydroxymandelate oxidase [Chloroflexota bacterium]